MGATMIASKLQDIKRRTDLSDIFKLLTEIRGLVQEFKRQSPQEPLPTAIVKAAYDGLSQKHTRRALNSISTSTERTSVWSKTRSWRSFGRTTRALSAWTWGTSTSVRLV